MGSISVREHIRWGTGDASEPTSTLVLTSPGRYFVDTRVLRAVPGDLARDQLDWAFGGTSCTAQVTRPDGSQVSHSTFRHWVDSRTTEPEKVVDEGDMLAVQPCGSTLETGHMVNPATGVDTDYEELWRDEQPQLVPGLARCTVFRLHEDASETRGLFIQLGQYAQGILRRGRTVTAERWVWNDSGSGWERLFRWGTEGAQALEDLVPGPGKTYEKDERVATTSGTWTVVEVTH